MRYTRLLYLFIPLLLLTCHVKQRVTKTNLAYLYYNDVTIIHPVYKVYHRNDSITSVFVRLKSSEILYSKNNPERKFQGKMVMRLEIFGLQDKKSLSLDTIFLIDRGGPSDDRYLIGEAELKLPYGKKYLAELTFDDQYRMQYVQDVMFIDKSDETSEENFLVTNEEGEILFGPYYDPGQKLFIESNHILPEKMHMLIYEAFDQLPPPPFAIQEGLISEPQRMGQEFIERKDKYHFELTLGEAGIYHFPSEEEQSSGLTFLVFHSYYPYIKTVASMVRPMRYVTTKQEYESVVKSNDLKKDVDDFWFKVAGNAERAAGIIEEYYGRVELANRYFTSYTQGWKTDRGLIYVIYGAPSSVIKTDTYENWMYSEKSNLMSVEFTFFKSNNQFSNNDYVLNRSLSYKSSWYRAIDGWRQGRIYQ